MANIPKLKSSKVNENVSVANILGSGEAEARAIESGTKQLQGIVKTVGDIVDLKVSQEAQNTARDAEFELQEFISDEGGKLKEQYLKQSGGKVTGFASWKAQRIQEKRNILSDKIGHRKVRDKFNDTTSYNIRKNYAYDARAENAEIKQIAKEESDKSLALHVLETQDLTPDGMGDKEFINIRAKAMDDLDAKRDLGLLGEAEYESRKQEITDTLRYSRIKSLVKNDNFPQAMKNFLSEEFSSPEMQAKVGDMMESEELRRLEKKNDNLELERKRQSTIKKLMLGEVRKKANDISNNPDMSDTEKAIELKKIFEDDSSRQYIDPTVVTQYQKFNTRAAIAMTSRLDRMVAETEDPNMLDAIVDKAGEFQVSVGANPELYKTLGKTIQRAIERKGRFESAFSKKFDRNYKKSYEFQPSEFHDSFQNHLAKYKEKGYAEEFSLQLAELEVKKEFVNTHTKIGNADPDTPQISRDLTKIVTNIGDFNNPEKQRVERERLIKEIEKGWGGITWLSGGAIEEQADSLIRQASEYDSVVKRYHETKERIIRDAERKPVIADE